MTRATRRGLWLTAGILLGWCGSLVLLLPTRLSHLPPLTVAAAVAVRTLLQTGLFIVAHDAMHGTLWPGRPCANRRMGQICLLLYAALPYGACRTNHVLHHRHAGTDEDPDHHGVDAPGMFRWYGRFMGAYLSPGQLTALVLSWMGLVALAAPLSPSALSNVLLYAALPTLLSSLQLFLVGTFLPHRAGGEAGTGAHRPRSLDWPVWLSLLGCYHFGYHWEHHAFPHLAWHELPAARQGIRIGG